MENSTTNGTNGTLVGNITTLSTWSGSESTTDSYFTTTGLGDIHLLLPTINYSNYSLETYKTIYWSVSASSLMLVLLACICLQTYVYRKGKNKIYAGLTREKTMAIKTSVEIEEDEDLCVWSVKILVEIERPLLVDVFKWAGVCAFCTGLLLAIPARYALIPLLLYDVSQAIHVCVLYTKKMENKDKNAVFQDVKRVRLSYTLFAGFPAGSAAKILGTLWLDGIWDSWGYSDFGFTILFAPHTILIFIAAPIVFFTFCCACCKCSESEPWEEESVTTVDVSGQIWDEVSHMMRESWSKNKMLIRGRDNRDHIDFKITKIQRVENPRLWSQYFCKLQDLSRKCARNPIDRAPWMHAYTCQLSGILNGRLKNELNEYYLFHGTSADVAEAICATGLDFRIGSEGLFGKGIYLAENSSKSDQYGKLNKDCRGTKGIKMFLVRACIGRPYLTREKKQFPRPPCTVKGCMQVLCTHTSHFDSVIADVSNMLYREFIVYEKTMCYPEYIITYDRIYM
ncbi:uncharacterized protein LOC106162513 [Lingula anatina]|uniref:Poly [ADP-ribose] polymerase n=1 Tax=Lingula anatina TaxID=7574 RepID=A0A1S3IAS9_LINAN|nr:uncharacterized protein LOC106162513 [Lingula anatina]|eukprot:XP_013395273.1 uncharacterized protein LOC106162513 [Lingula anatina]